MRLVNNNISPLPFYDNIALQNHRKNYAFGQVYPLITYKNFLLPFHVILSAGTAIQYVRLYNFNTGGHIDITDSMIDNGLAIVDHSNFKILRYFANLPISGIGNEGLHYLQINIEDLGVIYSDVFTITNRIEDCLLIEYTNSYNFELKNSIIDFTDNFKFRCYLHTQIGKPEYVFEEEATERMGYSFIKSQVSKKTYKFTFLAPEYLCDALRIVRMCDSKQIITALQTYDLTTFNMVPEWEEQGDIASVECEFETDTVIANIGGRDASELGGDFSNDFSNDFNNE